MTARNAAWMLLLALTAHAAVSQEPDPIPADVVTNLVIEQALSESNATSDAVTLDDRQIGLLERLRSESVIERVTRLGMPFVMKADEANAAAESSLEEPMLKSLTFQASHLVALRDWRLGGDPRPLPLDIGTEMEWDAETETYALSHVKLELLGERFWVVRDWREDSDEDWNLGIQFKKTW